MGPMQIIIILVVGFVAGLIARAILPGADNMGFIMTTIVGVVGSFVGSIISGIFSKPQPGQAFNPAGLVMSIIGAVVVLIIWRMIQ
jgi:uncharacterized membrane protein YeaQ/YmgE (transglycosylase-associated protein family)